MRAIGWTLGVVVAAAAALLWAQPGLGQEQAPDTAADAAAPEALPTSVPAERYGFTVTNIDLWGKRVEVTELWFPDAGIVCTVADAYGRADRMHASYGRPRDGRDIELVMKRQLRKQAAENGAQPLELELPPRESVEVPRALFERIQRLADLSRRRDTLATDLASDAGVRALFRADGGK